MEGGTTRGCAGGTGCALGVAASACVEGGAHTHSMHPQTAARTSSLALCSFDSQSSANISAEPMTAMRPPDFCNPQTHTRREGSVGSNCASEGRAGGQGQRARRAA
jgi:hypothetical protein